MNAINNNIEFLSEYEKDNIKIKCKCKICGHEWESTPSNLLRGKGCSKCHHRKLSTSQLKSTEKFIEEMHEINPSVEIIGEYTGAKNKIDCKCLIHNTYFKSSPTHLLQNKIGCNDCRHEKHRTKMQKSHSDFIKELNNINPNILVIGEYCGAKEKILVKCKVCGHIWNPEASSILNNGNGCPKCNLSKGEEKISKYLTEHQYDFIPQMKFKDLIGTGGRQLSYDFYLPSLNLLIEFQGQFLDGTAFMDKNLYYEKQLEHDLRKKQYAINNNINLLEIWYYDFDNIDCILENYLNNLKDPVTTTVA